MAWCSIQGFIGHLPKLSPHTISCLRLKGCSTSATMAMECCWLTLFGLILYTSMQESLWEDGYYTSLMVKHYTHNAEDASLAPTCRRLSFRPLSLLFSLLFIHLKYTVWQFPTCILFLAWLFDLLHKVVIAKIVVPRKDKPGVCKKVKLLTPFKSWL